MIACCGPSNHLYVGRHKNISLSEKSSTRGRPRTFNRETALDAAMMLFWKKSFTGASMNDLCEAMGIASPSLYAAFGSKEQLYSEAIRRYGELGEAQIDGILEKAPTAYLAVEAFLNWAADILTAADKPPGCMVVLSSVASEGLHDLGKIVCEKRQGMIEVLQTRLRRGIAEGDLPPDTDTLSLARYYITLHQGMSVQARDGACRKDLQATATLAMAAWPGVTDKY